MSLKNTILKFILLWACLIITGQNMGYTETKAKNPASKAVLKQSVSQEQNQKGAILLDSFDKTDWPSAASEKADVKVELSDGKEGKAIQINYNLKDTNQWASINKFIFIPNPDGTAIQFYLKSSGKNNNNLEVKLIDGDGSTFGYKVPLAGDNEWKKILIDLSDFAFWWGGDQELSDVKEIHFAISGGDSGSGTVYLDNLRLAASQKEKVKSGIIDKCDSTQGWRIATDQGASAKLISQSINQKTRSRS